MEFAIEQTFGPGQKTHFCGEFSEGARVALIGKSGAGKTTFMRFLAGLNQLNAGEVSFPSPSELKPWLMPVTYVHQQPVMFAHQTVSQTLRYPTKYNSKHNLPIDEWVGRLELDTVLNNRCTDLSGGQAQRVALLRALATGRKWLLLDESFSALDSQRLIAACDVVAEYCELTEAGILVASHNDTPQRFLCDEAYMIENLVGTAQKNLFSALDSQRHHLSSTLACQVQEVIHEFLRVNVGEQALYLRQPKRWKKGDARITIDAVDVSIAVGELHQTSMVNRLKAQLVSIDPIGTDRVLLTINLDSQPLKVVISNWSCNRLALKEGQTVFAEFKVGAVKWHGQLK